MNARIIRQLPHFSFLPVPDGLARVGYCEEKVDGFYCEADATGLMFKNKRAVHFASWPHQLAACRFVGELKDKTYHVFDVAQIGNQETWRLPLRVRKNHLADLSQHFAPWMKPIRCGSGGEFLEMILAEGGEGVVFKDLSAWFGKMNAWTKCKRSETFDCVVLGINSEKQSAVISQDGIIRGSVRVPLGIQVGDVIEVRIHSVHKSGKFREAVFIRARPDLTPRQS